MVERDPPGILADTRGIGDLSRWQIDVGTARAVILDYVYTLAETVGGITRAENLFSKMAKAGELPPEKVDTLCVANARRGKKGRTISKCRLTAWRMLERGWTTPGDRIARLAPKTRGKKWQLDADVVAALAKYRQPNKPSLAWCVNDTLPQLDGITFDSLYNRCRRVKSNLPKPVFYVGRNTGAALKALQVFRRREFLSLSTNDIWVGDGHGVKCKVAHPDTGNPFVPEVTVILDAGDRYAVGWSVSLSENCLAVSDALRHGVSRHGIPLIYYSDNGGGQKNKMFDAPVTGMLSALGIQHETGRPGNPQGRGVIERFWQTALIPLAKQFATYRGNGADRETLRKVSIDIDKQLRIAKHGEITALPKKLPTWRQFIDALDAAIHAYNTAHRHSSLPKLDGVNHATPAEYRAFKSQGVELHIPQYEEIAMLFMPTVLRKCERGEVKLWNGIYFHRDLMLIDGRYAPIGYDIHDCSRVVVKHPDSGQLIAVAKLNGNRDGYFPQPKIELLRVERAARRRKLLESKLDEVQAEFDGAPRVAAVSELEPAISGNVTALPSAKAPPKASPKNPNLVDARGCPTHDDFAHMDWLEANRDKMDDGDWDYFKWLSQKSQTIAIEFQRRFMPPAAGGEEEARL